MNIANNYINNKKITNILHRNRYLSTDTHLKSNKCNIQCIKCTHCKHIKQVFITHSTKHSLMVDCKPITNSSQDTYLYVIVISIILITLLYEKFIR